MLAAPSLVRLLVALVIMMAALSAVPSPPSSHPAQSTAGSGSTAGSWAREPDGAAWRVTLQFTNYNGDRLAAAISVPLADVTKSTEEFGYSKLEIQGLLDACRTCDQATFDRRLAEFYRTRGFVPERSRGQTLLTINMRDIVQRNSIRLRGTAQEVERIARDRGYDATATVGAALALVQTGIPYFSPPMEEDGREIAGLYVPPQVLAGGRGDCDSKSGLLASVLRNFSGARMVGINLPKHYLMGIRRVPQRGEAFVEYDGDQYVLLEPSGPGWLPPGAISDYSRDIINTMRDVRIDAFQ